MTRWFSGQFRCSRCPVLFWIVLVCAALIIEETLWRASSPIRASLPYISGFSPGTAGTTGTVFVSNGVGVPARSSPCTCEREQQELTIDASPSIV